MNKTYINIFLTLSILIFCVTVFNRFYSSGKITAVSYDKSIVDLGRVKLNKEIDLIFEIKNIGKEDLLIYDIQPDCSCILTKEKFKPIKKNDIAKIKVSYNNRNLGYFQKSITINCNIKSSPIVFTFQGKATK